MPLGNKSINGKERVFKKEICLYLLMIMWSFNSPVICFFYKF